MNYLGSSKINEMKAAIICGVVIASGLIASLMVYAAIIHNPQNEFVRDDGSLVLDSTLTVFTSWFVASLLVTGFACAVWFLTIRVKGGDNMSPLINRRSAPRQPPEGPPPAKPGSAPQ